MKLKGQKDTSLGTLRLDFKRMGLKPATSPLMNYMELVSTIISIMPGKSRK